MNLFEVRKHLKLNDVNCLAKGGRLEYKISKTESQIETNINGQSSVGILRN